MSEKIKIPEEVTSKPYEDYEQPSIRFDVKENENVTKHLLFYKTDKKQSFSKGHKPFDILFDMFMEIQNYQKLKIKMIKMILKHVINLLALLRILFHI